MAGYRTYLIAAAMVIITGLHGMGYISDGLYGTLQGLLMGGGFAALRAGIKADSGK